MIVVAQDPSVVLTTMEGSQLHSHLIGSEVIQELVLLDNYIALQLKLETILTQNVALKAELEDSNNRNLALQRLIVKNNVEVPPVSFISMVRFQLFFVY